MIYFRTFLSGGGFVCGGGGGGGHKSWPFLFSVGENVLSALSKKMGSTPARALPIWSCPACQGLSVLWFCINKTTKGKNRLDRFIF